jgi:hypothetical protein
VLAQTDDPLGTPSAQYLLYDGHGSTRQLVDDAAAIEDSFNYDAYGVMPAPATEIFGLIRARICNETCNRDALLAYY